MNTNYTKMSGADLVKASRVKAHRGLKADAAKAVRDAAIAEGNRRIANGSKFQSAWTAAGRMDEFLGRVSVPDTVAVQYLVPEPTREPEVKAVADMAEAVTSEQLAAWTVERTRIFEATGGGKEYREACAKAGVPVGKALRELKALVSG